MTKRSFINAEGLAGGINSATNTDKRNERQMRILEAVDMFGEKDTLQLQQVKLQSVLV